MLDKLREEPAVVSGAVQALLGLLLAFGVELSTVQIGAIMACTAAVLAFFVRSQVKPMVKVRNEAGVTDRYFLLVVVIAVMVLFILLIVAGVIKVS